MNEYITEDHVEIQGSYPTFQNLTLDEMLRKTMNCSGIYKSITNAMMIQCTIHLSNSSLMYNPIQVIFHHNNMCSSQSSNLFHLVSTRSHNALKTMMPPP